MQPIIVRDVNFPDLDVDLTPVWYQINSNDTVHMANSSTFESLKKKLNDTKSKLDEHESSKHYSIVTNNIRISHVNHNNGFLKFTNAPKDATVAYSKMYEMMNFIDSLGLLGSEYHKAFMDAELPGMFIMAYKSYMEKYYPRTETSWVASSYDPEGTTETYLTDKYNILKNNRDRWLMVKYKIKGDVTDKKDLEVLINGAGKVDLYTSDGGIDMDINTFNYQEEVQMKLKVGELWLGVNTLKVSPKSVLIVKAFTLFTAENHAILNEMCKIFEKVYVTKPFTSKPGNSEIYIIAVNKLSEEISTLGNIVNNILDKYVWDDKTTHMKFTPSSTTSRIYKAQEMLVNKQIGYIERSIRYATVEKSIPIYKFNASLDAIREELANDFLTTFKQHS